MKVKLKEHNHVFAHAQVFDFWTGGQEFKDVGMVIESFRKSVCIILNQLCLCSKTSQNQRSVIHGSRKVPTCVQSSSFGINFNAV